jgi:hypothetical protein
MSVDTERLADGVGTPAGCVHLAAALALARDRCKRALKDAHNPHHNYDYASADEVIATATAALAGSGLALVPVHESLRLVGSGEAAFYALQRDWTLAHESGESLGLSVETWPVIPDRGRPLDKAYCIALTTSLSYKLRDLLLMPRGGDDDVAAQVDGRETGSMGCPNLRGVTDAGTKRGAPAAGMPAKGALGAPPPPDLPVGSPVDPPGDPAAAITTEQCDRIAGLVSILGLSWAVFGERLRARYGVSMVRKLNAGQADEVERLLRDKLAQKKEAVKGG